MKKTLILREFYIGVVKSAQCMRLAGPIHHFPKLCRRRTSAMSNSDFTAVILRPCIKCGSVERFKDGACKPCKKARIAKWQADNQERMKVVAKIWRTANPDKRKTTNEVYRSANADKVRARVAAWASANPEKVKAAQAAYRAANPEKAKASRLAYEAANPEKKKARTLAYRAANPEAYKTVKRNRSARERAAGGKLSRDLIQRLVKLQKGMCPCCSQPLGDNYHMDHIIPLVLGGKNTDDNIQLMRAKCNLQKNKKDPVQFMQERGFLL